MKPNIPTNLMDLPFSDYDIIQCLKDINVRLSWNISSLCSIYSPQTKQSYKGEVCEITDEDWLTVKYNNGDTKKIHRFDKHIKPIGVYHECNPKLTQIIVDKLKLNQITPNQLLVAQKDAELCLVEQSLVQARERKEDETEYALSLLSEAKAIIGEDTVYKAKLSEIEIMIGEIYIAQQKQDMAFEHFETALLLQSECDEPVPNIETAFNFLCLKIRDNNYMMNPTFNFLQIRDNYDIDEKVVEYKFEFDDNDDDDDDDDEEEWNVADLRKLDRISQSRLEEEAETGDVILWAGQSAGSRVIRLFTRSVFSHASVLIRGTIERNGTVYGKEGELGVFQATGAGLPQWVNETLDTSEKMKVQLTPLEDNISINYDEQEWGVFIKLNVSDGRRSVVEKAIKQFASKSIGNEYLQGTLSPIDIEEIFRSILGIGKKRSDRYVCSDLVACAYKAAGILPKDKPLSMDYMPGSFCAEEYAEKKMRFFWDKPIVNKYLSHTKLEKGQLIDSSCSNKNYK